MTRSSTRDTEAPPPELPAIAERWLDMLRFERRLAPLTLKNYRRDLELLVSLSMPRALDALSPHDIRRFAARQHAGGLSGRSIARQLSTWRGFFGWWGEQGGIPANPVTGIKAPRSPRLLPKALSPEQAQALLDTPQEHLFASRDKAMFELLYSSGLRLSELASLALDDGSVDLAAREITVTGKRGKTRMSPIGGKAMEALQLWLADRPRFARPEVHALFVNTRGHAISPRSIEVALTQWAQRSGLGVHVHPHMLRHSFASHLLQSSGDLRAVQELLGHASISATQIYTHLDFQHLAKVYDAAHPRARKK